ncbi:MIR motif-containing protein, partial [Thamnocephalis sphaerospora]
GTGSGQQSVTGLQASADPDCLWQVNAAMGEECRRGEPVKCGQSIRLVHYSTSKLLHSHRHTSPLSNNQEVSAFDGQDAGDNWTVECVAADSAGAAWRRETPVRLQHAETDMYLYASDAYMYGSPIRGQMEVSAVSAPDDNTLWRSEVDIALHAVPMTVLADDQ